MDMKTGKQESHLFTKPYERLCINPFVYHVFVCKGESSCIVIVASDREFDAEKPDTYSELQKMNI